MAERTKCTGFQRRRKMQLYRRNALPSVLSWTREKLRDGAATLYCRTYRARKEARGEGDYDVAAADKVGGVKCSKRECLSRDLQSQYSDPVTGGDHVARIFRAGHLTKCCTPGLLDNYKKDSAPSVRPLRDGKGTIFYRQIAYNFAVKINAHQGGCCRFG